MNSEVASVVQWVISGVFALLLVVAREVWTSEKKKNQEALDRERDARKDLERKVETHVQNTLQMERAFGERLRLDELATVEQKGKIALLEQRHDGLASDISEIKAQQVPRAEWEKEMGNVTRMLMDIQREIRANPRSRGYGSDPAVPSATR